MNLEPRAQEALEALSAVVESYADVFRPSCPDHDEDEDECDCQRHLTGLVLVHEWTRVSDDMTSSAWHSGIGTGYHQSKGMLHEALHFTLNSADV